MEPRIGKRTKWWLRGVLGAMICGCHSTKPDPKLTRHSAWPPEASSVDRQLTNDPLARQARNGAVVESTLFNHHFRDDYKERLNDDGTPMRLTRPLPTSDLLLSGSNLIQRLARRHSTGDEFCLFVEVANDLPIDPKNPSTLAKRDEINRKRVEEVEQFARAVRPDLLVRVELLDPDAVGMSSREAIQGLLQHILNSHGTLRPDSYDPKSGESKIPEPPKIDLPMGATDLPGALSPGN